uniref:RNA polymerase sigma factor n=1 Tax=Pedobacter schmidteae TaxID=2201271 RepID=UPI000EAEFB9C|nr:RNA polymerase sigma-70 factor [Pedobacter schmidteae]
MTTKPLDNEQQLVADMARGDQNAFRKIYDHYRPLVYSFSLKYLKSPQQAEEVVQETFLKLWRIGEGLSAIKHLDSYMLTMSRNRCMDVLRRMKLEAMHIEPLTDDLDSYTNETEERILLNDTKKLLDEAIAQLPPQQQLVYTLCHIQGRRQDEVARELQLSPETVKRHMKLALKFLREYLGTHTDITIILIILKII